jgi:hypothetical protein
MSRIPAPEGEQRYQRRKREERETDVWRRQVHAIGTPEPGSMWVHVGDPRADMVPFFQACRSTQTHFLVRAAQNRRVQESEEEISYSLTQARAFPSQASRPFEVPARHGHPGRSTQLQLAFGQMTLLPPRARATRKQGAVDRVGHSCVGRTGERCRGAAGMDLGDLGSHHHARTSLGAGRVVSTPVAGGGLSSLPQKRVSH